jgi:hypothetical protein
MWSFVIAAKVQESILLKPLAQIVVFVGVTTYLSVLIWIPACVQMKKSCQISVKMGIH